MEVRDILTLHGGKNDDPYLFSVLIHLPEAGWRHAAIFLEQTAEIRPVLITQPLADLLHLYTCNQQFFGLFHPHLSNILNRRYARFLLKALAK